MTLGHNLPDLLCHHLIQTGLKALSTLDVKNKFTDLEQGHVKACPACYSTHKTPESLPKHIHPSLYKIF